LAWSEDEHFLAERGRRSEVTNLQDVDASRISFGGALAVATAGDGEARGFQDDLVQAAAVQNNR